jgi:hypothetical protein
VAQQPDSLNDISVLRWLHAESHRRRWETANPLSAWKSCWFRYIPPTAVPSCDGARQADSRVGPRFRAGERVRYAV